MNPVLQPSTNVYVCQFQGVVYGLLSSVFPLVWIPVLIRWRINSLDFLQEMALHGVSNLFNLEMSNVYTQPRRKRCSSTCQWAQTFRTVSKKWFNYFSSSRNTYSLQQDASLTPLFLISVMRKELILIPLVISLSPYGYHMGEHLGKLFFAVQWSIRKGEGPQVSCSPLCPKDCWH